MKRLPEMTDVRGQHPAPLLAVEIGDEFERRSGESWLSVSAETRFLISGCLDAPNEMPAGSSLAKWREGERAEPGFGYLMQTVVYRETPNVGANRAAD